MVPTLENIFAKSFYYPIHELIRYMVFYTSTCFTVTTYLTFLPWTDHGKPNNISFKFSTSNKITYSIDNCTCNSLS